MDSALKAPVAAAATPATPPLTNSAPAQTPDQIKEAATVNALQQTAQMVRDGDLDGALTKLNAIIQADPRNVSAFVLRGQVYSEKKMPDQESNDFQAAHLLDPANPVVNFDEAEVKFTQKSYDAARIGFADLAKDKGTMIGELAAYKVFLCDLIGNHSDMASKEFDVFNQAETGASYYYANAAWDLAHHRTEDARGWLASADQIYTPEKNTLYSRSLEDLGFLPLPPPPAQ